ncbi:probable WRKY transcription factor 14 [Argentina anserina]|uniref:probable WRKY transcription factor 14 n=1 Tax=Argentina anserina TaxID=57926 RepID=UPI0021763B74|nr:probable WRKY transcription factor 14 [Potentilla anserina]
MCSLSMPIGMENYQGDLTDILRAGAATGSSSSSAYHSETMNSDNWQFSSDDNHSMKFSTSLAMEEEVEDARDNFGDPFSSYIRDPLLHELSSTSTGGFFSSPNSTSEMNISVDMEARPAPFGAHVLGHHHQGEVIKRPSNNIFSRMLQISPGKLGGDVSGCDSVAVLGSPRGGGVGGGIKAGPGGVMAGSDMINANSSKGCLLENTGVGVQISSPRNPGIKRRKSQAKKVICIPAPAAANSRPTGEVVPSDLWAWRKYGQKPIKGSPYPRGYYRCSSSKGCSARKQVERSRTDPNMLVITYTSEHNHPWPTQRNALAGSTRSQPSKAGAGTKTAPNTAQRQKPNSPAKEEQKAAVDSMDENNHVPSPVNATVGSSSTVKEEFEDIENLQLEVDHHHHHHQNDSDHHQFSNHEQGFPYRPSMPEHSSNQSEDFFADLGEIEADPLHLLFSQCFTEDEQIKGRNKCALDPFNLFDWSGDQNTNINLNNDPSFGQEAKRRL